MAIITISAMSDRPFVKLLVYELPSGPETEEPVSIHTIRERFAGRVEALDGSTCTLVTAYGPKGAHLAVGGDAAAGVVVYATLDNVSFYQLRDGRRAGDPVEVIAGGQPAEYRGDLVVATEYAIRTAEPFLLYGRFGDGDWIQADGAP